MEQYFNKNNVYEMLRNGYTGNWEWKHFFQPFVSLCGIRKNWWAIESVFIVFGFRICICGGTKDN